MTDEASEVKLPEESGQKIEIYCEVDGVTTRGMVERRDLSLPERTQRAAKVFGILFVIGLGTIVVPILHFILPPLFLIAAIFFASTTYMETAMVLRGQIACPNCKHVMNFPREAEEWPQVRRCDGCSFTLTIRTVPN